MVTGTDGGHLNLKTLTQLKPQPPVPFWPCFSYYQKKKNICYLSIAFQIVTVQSLKRSATFAPYTHTLVLYLSRSCVRHELAARVLMRSD